MGPQLPVLAGLGARVRAGQWWSFKLIPTLIVAYATCAVDRQPIAYHWADLLLLLVTLSAGAMAVSVLNDLTDRADDRLAGKENRMARGGGITAGIALVASIFSFIVFVWMRHDDTWSIVTYLGIWSAFLLYSLPPVRLKRRGLWGGMADATGAHLLTALLAALIVSAPGAIARGLPWLGSVAWWALALGLRGIISHQLADHTGDQRAGTRTLVIAISPLIARRFVKYATFPVELVALGAMLIQIASPAVWLSLAVYLPFVLAKIMLFQVRAVVVDQPPRSLALMQDYYLVFLPIALLVDATRINPTGGVVLAAHLLLFSVVVAVVVVDLGRLGWRLQWVVRQRCRSTARAFVLAR